MKKISTILLVTLSLIVIVFTVFVDSFIDKGHLSEIQEPIYEQTENLMDDLHEKNHEAFYNEYFSSNVKSKYTKADWKRTYEKMVSSELIPSENSYSLDKESLSQKASLVGNNPDRYYINIDLDLKTNQSDSQVILEWVKEDKDIKLHYMEFPFEEKDNELHFITFGIQ
ncbi:hypothetical protein [Alkalibacillus haloalkaliphilus]|uniref:hypothetical protein n=1 Tax=Alkalibacillus haloalkaliphilus TaxID=94136 RepID=UPI0029354900|nr:hypothetical protein [Alkalibacillus haloalkaliphilus]MDV2583482.1 hypothetical protein [Alkalibacillus haloalkaliphilus]